jgi:hypothetical protein
MPEKLKWLNSEQEYEFASHYIHKHADSDAYKIAGTAAGALPAEASTRRKVEAAITALLVEGYSDFVTHLKNSLRQYRLRKTRPGWKQRTFTLPDTANNALAKLARDYNKPQTSIIAELVTDTSNLMQLQEAKYKAENAKKNLTQQNMIQGHEKRNRVLIAQIEKLEEYLLEQVRAVTLWQLSVGSDTPPFDGDLNQACLEAETKYKEIRSKIQRHAQIHQLLPSPVKTSQASGIEDL